VDDDGAGLRMVHLLRAITVQLDLFGAEFAAAHQLNATDLRALIALLDAARDARPATPGWLMEQLGINSASVTGLIDRLERGGLLRRERDTADRRRVLLVVEEQAVSMGWSFFGPLITSVVGALEDFDEAERSTIHRFLLRVEEVVASSRHRPDRPAGSGRPPRSEGHRARTRPDST
jgi:DNA-binding MarR family transcriptional regulator